MQLNPTFVDSVCAGTDVWYTIVAQDSSAQPYYRVAVGPEELFSASSSLGTARPNPAADRWLDRPIEPDRWSVSLLALGVVLFYCWIVFRYRKVAATSLKAALSLEEAFMVFDHMPHEFHRFLAYARLLLVSSMAVLVLLYPLLWGGGPLLGRMVLLWWVGAVFYVYGSMGVQQLLLWLVSRFDAVPERLGMLGNLNRLDRAVIALFFPPVVLVALGFDGVWPVAVGVFGLGVLAHWLRLFVYFKHTGFSIVQWFLYLCTLEVLPYTLFWGLGRTLGFFH